MVLCRVTWWITCFTTKCTHSLQLATIRYSCETMKLWILPAVLENNWLIHFRKSISMYFDRGYLFYHAGFLKNKKICQTKLDIHLMIAFSNSDQTWWQQVVYLITSLFTSRGGQRSGHPEGPARWDLPAHSEVGAEDQWWPRVPSPGRGKSHCGQEACELYIWITVARARSFLASKQILCRK